MKVTLIKEKINNGNNKKTKISKIEFETDDFKDIPNIPLGYNLEAIELNIIIHSKKELELLQAFVYNSLPCFKN